MIAPNEPTACAATAKKSRVKVTAPQISTTAEASAALTMIAIAVNQKRKIIAAMDAEILRIKDRRQPSLTECDNLIQAHTEDLAVWAEAHPEIFPDGLKSVQFAFGKFGFRTDPPSLALARRDFGWAKILVMLIGRRLRKFVRIKHEVDKDRILAHCGTLKKATKFQREVLPTLGLKLVQEEKFFVEPDLTKVEA